MSSTKHIKIEEYEFTLDSKHVIGKGSFGIVYKGNHITSKKEVAIKKIRLQHEEDDKAIFNEVKSMDCLQNHRHVVRLLAAQLNIIQMECLVVMELCELGDLQSYLKTNKHLLKLPDKIDLMYQAVLPIAFMHRQDPPIIHRDIKPGNFLLQRGINDSEIILKVTDFGLAKLFDRSKASETMMLSTLCGTQPYMAPEFWVDGNLDYSKAVDNFSLGLMFLVILQAKEGSSDIPLTVKARSHNFIASVGQEMQRKFMMGKDMPPIVEIDDGDSETLTAVKLMIHDMIDYTPSQRLSLDQVQSTLEAKIDPKKKYIQAPIAMQREVSNADMDSGITDSYPDSVGFSMLRSVQADSAIQSTPEPVDGATGSNEPEHHRNEWEMSMIEQLRHCLESATVYGSVFKPGDTRGDFKCEEVVRIVGDAKEVKRIHKSTNEWQEDMQACIGFPGVITGVENGKSRIRFINQKTFIFKNEVIEKENLDKNKMGGGDYVVVKADRKEVKAIQDKSTGFVSGMAQLLGKPGIVRCVKSNEGKTDRVKIEHHGKDNFWWSKDALILVAKGEELIRVLLGKK